MDKDYTINIKEEGSDKVIRAFNDVANAEDKAAQGATDLGNASEKAQGKMSKLGSALGGALGKAAAAVGPITAVTGALASNASAGEKASTVLGTVSGVAAAFGPWGAAISAAAGIASAAISLFSDEAEEATEESKSLLETWRELGNDSGFFVSAIGQMLDQLEKLGATANETTKRMDALKAAQDAFAGAIPSLTLATEAQRQTGMALLKLQKEQEEAIAAERDNVDKLTDAYQQGIVPQNIYALAIRETNDRLAEAQGQYAITKKATDNFVESVKKGQEPIEAAANSTNSLAKATYSLADAEAHLAQLSTQAAAARAAMAKADEQIRARRGADAGARMGAEVSAVVSLMPNTDETQQQIEQMQAIQSEADTLAGIYNDLTANVSAFGDAAATGFASAAVGAILLGGSFKELLNQQLEALTVQAGIEALKMTATGLGYLAAAAFGYGPGVAAAGAAFKSAAVWGALAVGAGVATAATGGFSGGGGGGASTPTSGGTAGDLGPNSNSGGGGPVQNTYIIQNSGVIGLDRDLDRRFAEGTRREQQRPGGIRQRR